MNDQQQDQHQKKYQAHAMHVLTEQVQQGLDDAADGLDMRLQSRLRHMRAQAVESVEQPSVAQRIWRRMNDWLFTNPVMQGAAFASVATLALSLWLMPGYQAGGDDEMTVHSAATPAITASHAMNTAVRQEVGADVNEMDVLMSNEDMDFLENLEVYEWLEAEYG